MALIGGEDDGDRQIGVAGITDQRLGGRNTAVPVGDSRPAVVDDEHQRPCIRQRRIARIEYGIGERQDDQRRQHDAQQRQPPRALRRRFLALQDARENAKRREDFRFRPGWSELQQPPDQWQDGKGDQDGGRAEGERQRVHGAVLRLTSGGVPERYMWTATRASEARRSVEWWTKLQPRRRSCSPRFSRRAR